MMTNVFPPLRADQDVALARVNAACGPRVFADVKRLVQICGGWKLATGIMLGQSGDFSDEAITLLSALAMKAERELAEAN